MEGRDVHGSLQRSTMSISSQRSPYHSRVRAALLAICMELNVCIRMTLKSDRRGNTEAVMTLFIPKGSIPYWRRL